MDNIVDFAEQVYDLDLVNGEPQEPPKENIIELFGIVSGQILLALEALGLGQTILYASTAAMNADLVPADGKFGLVWGAEPATLNQKVGGTGTGSWTYLRDFTLPSSVISDIAYLMAVAGAGPLSANAIGTFAQRSEFDDELAGFTYMDVTIPTIPVFWVRSTDVEGVWVGPYSFAGSAGPLAIKPIEVWVTATAYVTGPPASFVSQGGASYICAIAHTSGVFATDLAAGKWIVSASSGSVATATAAEARAGTDAVKGMAPAQTAATRGQRHVLSVGGTANAITATSALGTFENDVGRAVSFTALFTNTSSTVTMATDAKAALTVKTEFGADPPVGGIVAGQTYEAEITAGPFLTVYGIDVSAIATFPLPRQEFEGAISASSNVQQNSDGSVERTTGTAAFFTTIPLSREMDAARAAGQPVTFYCDLVAGSAAPSAAPYVTLLDSGGVAIGANRTMTLVGTRYSVTVNPLDVTTFTWRFRWSSTTAVRLSRCYVAVNNANVLASQVPVLTENSYKQSKSQFGPLNIASLTSLATTVGAGGTRTGNQIFAPSGTLVQALIYNPPGFLTASDDFIALIHVSRGFIKAVNITPDTGLGAGQGATATNLRYIGKNLAIITGPAVAVSGREAKYFTFQVDARAGAGSPVTAGDNTVTLLFFGKGSILPTNARLLADAPDRAAFVNAGAAGGDGSYARPFATVTEAQNAGANHIFLRVSDTPHRGALGYYGARSVKLLPYRHSTDTVKTARLWAWKELTGADFVASTDATYPNLWFYPLAATPGALWKHTTGDYTDPARNGEVRTNGAGASFQQPSASLAVANAVADRWFWGTGTQGTGIFVRPFNDTFASTSYEIAELNQKDAVEIWDCGNADIGIDIWGGREIALNGQRSGLNFVNKPIIGYSGNNNAIQHDSCRVSGSVIVWKGGNDGFSTVGFSRGAMEYVRAEFCCNDGVSNHGSKNESVFNHIRSWNNGKCGIVDIGTGSTRILSADIGNNFGLALQVAPSSAYGTDPTSVYISYANLHGGECQIDNSLGGGTLTAIIDGLHDGSILVAAPANAEIGAGGVAGAGTGVGANVNYTEVRINNHRVSDTLTKELLEVNGGYVTTEDFRLFGGTVGMKISQGMLLPTNGSILGCTVGVTKTGGTFTTSSARPLYVPTGAALFANGAQVSGALTTNLLDEQEPITTRPIVSGLAASAVAASTEWSAAIFVCPQVPVSIDGYWTSQTMWGTNAERVRCLVLTKNGDGTYTQTAAAEFDVPIGKSTVTPNLRMLAGQYMAWMHNGIQHYDGNPSGTIVVDYFNSEPTVSSTKTGSLTTRLQYSATFEPTVRGLGTTLDARVVTLEGGTQSAVVGKAAGSVGTATAWSGAVYASPQDASPLNGKWTSFTVKATNAGQLTCQVHTRNVDKTVTVTAEKSFDVPSGVVTVIPDLTIRKGQYVAFIHTGILHYTLNSGNIIVAYFNTKPSTNSARSAQIRAAVEYSVTIMGGSGGLDAVHGRRLATLENATSITVTGKDPGTLGAGTTTFSNLVWVSPQEAIEQDGYLVDFEINGNAAGSVDFTIVERNSDNTFNNVFHSIHSVDAGIQMIHPDCFVKKGQYVCLKHTGGPRYTAGGEIGLWYFSTSPTVNTPRTSLITGILEYSAKVVGTYEGLRIVLAREIAAGGAGGAWNGLDGAFLGTSLTGGDGWVGLVQSGLGLATAVDLGAGGGMICEWDPGGGTIGGQIMDAIASIPAGTHIVFLEGFVNDWWNGAPLGTPDLRVQGTFYGAMRAAYAAIHAQAPNAMIVLLADWNTSSVVPPYIQESEDTNSIGKYPYEYQEAMERSARMNGLKFIRLYELRGFWTPSEYADHIHPPASGMPQIRTATYILDELRGILPLT